jgi:putative RHS-family protein
VVPPGGAPQLACEWVQDVQRRKLVVRDWLAAANLPKTGADTRDDSAQPFVETTYVSDALGRLERVERAQLLGGAGSACGYRDGPVSDFAAAGAYTVRYAYDADSRLVEQVTPYEHTTLAYTPAGRLSQARSGPDDMTIQEQEPTRFAYDALGYLESTQLDETVARWVRDAAGAVVEYTEQGTCGPERGVRVERNELGKITRVEDTVAGIACTYSYDAAGRLIRAVNSTGYAVDWVYDHAGLLLRKNPAKVRAW